MKQLCLTYRIQEVAEYINWDYFLHAWGLESCFSSITLLPYSQKSKQHWVQTFDSSEKKEQAHETIRLYSDALNILNWLEQKSYTTKALFRLCKANSIEDDILINNIRFPFLRQQTIKSISEPNLCLSDFIRPLSAHIPDQIGLFATTIDTEIETNFTGDDYHHLLVKILADRLTEATAEKLHEDVRKTYWGYTPQENFTPKQLHNELYQGIRPAIGYPSLPDISINFLLDELLNMKEIGITLTENGAMKPQASVSGFMFAHPLSRYFSIGKISEQQLESYAQRRGFNIKQMKKYLAKVL